MSVVNTLFPNAITLYEYCIKVINDEAAISYILKENDSVQYKELLDTTFILIDDQKCSNQFDLPINPSITVPIREIISRFISQNIRNRHNIHYTEQNCLTLGYRSKSEHGDFIMRNSGDIECYFVNTIQAIITTQLWQLLANRIGEEILMHLLSFPIFLKCKNSCYMQISGPSISELIYKDNKTIDSQSSNKYNQFINKIKNKITKQTNIPKENEEMNNDLNDFKIIYEESQLKSLQDISLVPSMSISRNKIFYKTYYQKSIGLPTNHCFNKKNKESIQNHINKVFLPIISLFYDIKIANMIYNEMNKLFLLIRTNYKACLFNKLIDKYCSFKSIRLNAIPINIKNVTTINNNELLVNNNNESNNNNCCNSNDFPMATNIKVISNIHQNTNSSDSNTTLLSSHNNNNSYNNNNHSNNNNSKFKLLQTLTLVPLHDDDSNDATQANTTNTTATTTATSNDNMNNTNELLLKSNRKYKRKRGCRSGKLVKSLQVEKVLSISSNNNNNTTTTNNTNNNSNSNKSHNNNSSNNNNNSEVVHSKIITTIDEIWKPYQQSKLVTIGQKLVNNVFESIKTSINLQDNAIYTQQLDESYSTATNIAMNQSDLSSIEILNNDHDNNINNNYNSNHNNNSNNNKNVCENIVINNHLYLDNNKSAIHLIPQSIVMQSNEDILINKRKFSDIDSNTLNSNTTIINNSFNTNDDNDVMIHTTPKQLYDVLNNNTEHSRSFQYEISTSSSHLKVDTSNNSTSVSDNLTPIINITQPDNVLSNNNILSNNNNNNFLFSNTNKNTIDNENNIKLHHIQTTTNLNSNNKNKKKKLKRKFRTLLKHMKENSKPVLNNSNNTTATTNNSTNNNITTTTTTTNKNIMSNTNKDNGHFFILPHITIPKRDSGLMHHLNRPFYTKLQNIEKNTGNQSKDINSSTSIKTIDTKNTTNNHHIKEDKKKKPNKFKKLINSCDLLSLKTPKENVSEFIKSICRIVFPIHLIWGTRHNMNAFLSMIDVYIKLGRHETILLSHIIHSIRLSDIPWLHNISNHFNTFNTTTTTNNNNGNTTNNDNKNNSNTTNNSSTNNNNTNDNIIPNKISKSFYYGKEQLFYHFMYWMYDDFINSLMASCFYITEVEGRGSEVLYYRKPIWNGIVQRGQHQLADNFIQVYMSDEVTSMINPNPNTIKTTTNNSIYNNNTTTTTANHNNSTTNNNTNNNNTNNNNNESTNIQRNKSLPNPSSSLLHSYSHLPITSSTSTTTSTTTLSVKSATIPTTNVGSILFNDLLKASHSELPSLAETNNAIINTILSCKPKIISIPMNNNNNNNNNNVLKPIKRRKKKYLHTHCRLKVIQNKPSIKLKNFLLKIPSVRFIPKKSSVRAITNLRTRKLIHTVNINKTTIMNNTRPSNTTTTTTTATTKTANVDNHKLKANTVFTAQYGEVLTNSSLYSCYHVLKSIYNRNPALGGFGSFGLDDIYLKLTKYKSMIKTNEQHSNKPIEKYYMAVLDIEKCYDNVDTTLLYDLVSEILIQKASLMNKDEHNPEQVLNDKLNIDNVIHKYSISHPVLSMNRNVCKNIRYVSPSGNLIPFQEASEELVKYYPYSIITDAVIYPKMNYKEVLNILKIHLFQHIIKLPYSIITHLNDNDNDVKSIETNCCYNQIKGLPQGSILSPLLCTLYYGNAERYIFGSNEDIELIGIQDKSVVIRLMDDYIIISTEQSCVEHFLKQMFKNLKSYGSKINPLKTKVNFNCILNIDNQYMNIECINNNEMPWCGLLINSKTLEISCNFQKILDLPITSSVLIECHKSGLALKRAIKTFMRSKCHAIVLDEKLNSKFKIMKTLYSMYLIASLRTIAYLNKIRIINHHNISQLYLSKCIKEGIVFGAKLINIRTIKKVCKNIQLDNTEMQYNFELMNEIIIRNTGRENHILNIINDKSMNLQLFAQCIETFEPECFGHCSVSFQEICWLGLHAFITVLKQNQALYKQSIKWLTNEQLLLKSTSHKYKLDSNKMFTMYQECNNEIIQKCKWV